MTILQSSHVFNLNFIFMVVKTKQKSCLSVPVFGIYFHCFEVKIGRPFNPIKVYAGVLKKTYDNNTIRVANKYENLR